MTTKEKYQTLSGAVGLLLEEHKDCVDPYTKEVLLDLLDYYKSCVKLYESVEPNVSNSLYNAIIS